MGRGRFQSGRGATRAWPTKTISTLRSVTTMSSSKVVTELWFTGIFFSMAIYDTVDFGGNYHDWNSHDNAPFPVTKHKFQWRSRHVDPVRSYAEMDPFAQHDRRGRMETLVRRWPSRRVSFSRSYTANCLCFRGFELVFDRLWVHSTDSRTSPPKILETAWPLQL